MSLARFVVWAPRRSSVTLMIKKVGEEMAASPEWKDIILGPLKSQGVSRMYESALIFSASW